MYNVGSIIIVSNQIFRDGKSTRTSLDHAPRRPALVISEDDEFFYYLTLSSSPGKGRIKFNTHNRVQYVEKRNIYKKHIYGAEEVDATPDKELLKVLLAFYDFHKDKEYPEFKNVEKDVLLTIKKLLGNDQKSI